LIATQSLLPQAGGKNSGGLHYPDKVFPVSRHVMLVGATRKIKPVMATYNRVAALNTFMMMTAEAQVYSHTPDFYWLDENGKSQTDWRLLSKEKLMDSEATGIQIAAYAEP
jgi:hypothetical protein